MLPGFSAAASLYRSRQVYRVGCASSASNGFLATETGVPSRIGNGLMHPVTPAGLSCAGPNCPPQPPYPTAQCGAECLQQWIDALSDCLYSCKTKYSGPGGESESNLSGCDSQCQSTFGPSNWKCDCPPGSICNGSNCVSCPGGVVNGKCAACPQGTINCGGICCSASCCNNDCTNTATDPKNCGKCGNLCASGQSCQNGVCSCPSGQVLCNGTCCPSGQTCQNGACSCPTGQVLCNGTCTDTSTDNKNCGKCGNPCGVGQTCEDGKCLTFCCDRGSPNCMSECESRQSCCSEGLLDFCSDNCNCCCNEVPCADFPEYNGCCQYVIGLP
jgi:hypothetical protein